MNGTNKMTDYAKKQLNGKIREYVALNGEKNELVKDVKELGNDIKIAMGEAGVDEYSVAGIKATVKAVVKRELDKEKIAKLLGGKIPDDCYVLKSEMRLNVA